MLGNRERPAVKKRMSQTEVDEIARNFRVGIFLQDNPNDAGSEGWAFERDREPQRIRTMADLSNLMMWITSCEIDAFNRGEGRKIHNVRKSDYLGLPLQQLAKDLGMRIDGGFAVQNGPRLLPHVERTVQLAISMYRMEEPGRQLQQDSLQKAIQRMVPDLPPVPETVGALNLAAAYQSFSSIRSSVFFDNAVLINLRFSRVEYALWLLSNNFPDQGWTHITHNVEAELGALGDDTRPFLVEGTVELDRVATGVGELIAFGVGPKKEVQRRWMTDVEYRWITAFARVQAVSLIQCEQSVKLSSSFKLPDNMVLDPVMYQVVSFGVLAHAHWTALAAERWSMTLKRGEPDLIATWLSAYDRMKCFQAAYLLFERRFTVFGYGKGSVSVRVTRDRLPELRDIAESIGMAWPTWDAIFNEYGYGNESATSETASA